MERDGIVGRLRRETPTAAAPGGLRARLEERIAGEPPGRERVAGTPRPGRVGAAVAVLAAGGLGLWALTGGPAPGPAPEPGRVASAPGAASGLVERLGALRPVALDRPDPLTAEARHLWADVQRIRGAIEGPVRTLGEVGKSL